MAREWQPGSRQEPAPPPHDSSTESVTGSVPVSEPGPAKGPGGTTGWFPEQDCLRRTRHPAEDQPVDTEAETRHQPAVAEREAPPRTDSGNEEVGRGSPHQEHEERYTEGPAANPAGVAAAGGPERSGTDPGEAPGAASPEADEPRELSGAGEEAAAETPPERSRWQRLVNRTTGGGPLSAGRVARERVEQTPPGGNGSPDPALRKDPRHRQDPDLEPGGTMDPSLRMRRIAEQINRGDRDPHTAEKYDDEEEEEAAREGLARGGPLVWLIDHWKVIALPLGALCMLTFVVATVGLPNLGGGGEVASSEGSPSGEDAARTTSGSGSERAPLYDSGLSFQFAEKDDGTVVLTAGGDLEWTGRVEQVSKQEAPEGGEAGSAATAAVEVLRLSGPTAAEVGPGYTMDSGSDNPGQKSTTVFAVEGSGVPDLHATFDLFTGLSGEGATQRANGTYAITADSGELIAEGDYSDHRTGGAGGREVIRTYTEQVPGESGSFQFKVRYEADKAVPIPLLVGWQTPEERPEDLRLGGQL